MSLPLSVLICLLVHLCMGDQLVEEVITTKHVPLLGSWSEMNPESTEVKEAVKHAVTEYNTRSKGKKLFKLDSIKAAKTQVTSVINYKIDVVLVKTKCLKAENHDLESCSLDKKHVNCHLRMTFDPRKNKHELVHRHCHKQQ